MHHGCLVLNQIPREREREGWSEAPTPFSESSAGRAVTPVGAETPDFGARAPTFGSELLTTLKEERRPG